MKSVKYIVVFYLLVTAAGCVDDPNRRAKIGAGVGALAGAVLGHQVDGDKGRYIGAVAGALAGGSVGYYMDKQQKEFERALAEEQRRHELEIERVKEDLLKVSLDSSVTFDTNSSDLKPPFYPTLDKLTDVLRRYDSTVVHVIGHTDSSGSESYNMDLSQRRATAVADYQVSRGVPGERIRTGGRGESQPITSNSTAGGRKQNRRVEIFIKPIVVGEEQQAFVPPA